MKMITAVVRTTSLEDIVSSLEAAGIRGMTIVEVKGTGEEVSLNRPYTIHHRLEIVVADDKTEDVAGIILQHGRMCMAGDGLIAVTSLDYMIKIRTEERLR